MIEIYEITNIVSELFTMDVFGIGSMIGSLGSAGIQAGQNKKQRRWASDEARAAYTRDRQMWMDQNEYNSPKNQMARFEEAGLNPHLAVTGGDPGNATTMPKYNAPRGEFGIDKIALPNMIGLYQNFMKGKEEIKNLKQNRYIMEEIERGKGMDNILKDWLIGTRPEWAKYQDEYHKERSKQFKMESKRKYAESEWSQLRLDRFHQNMGQDINRDNRIMRILDELIQNVIDGNYKKSEQNSYMQ